MIQTLTKDETPTAAPPAPHPQHRGEEQSNDYRRRLAAGRAAVPAHLHAEPGGARQSAGSYHWTPEGRKLADFSSGVLVTNLGHNPTRWWQRVIDYLGLARRGQHADGEFCRPCTLDGLQRRHRSRDAGQPSGSSPLLQSQPGGARCEQVLWAASGSEAIQKALWAALDRRPGDDIILATRYGFHGKKGLAGAVTGSETDQERDPRVQVHQLSRWRSAATSQRRRQPIDLAPYEAELDRACGSSSAAASRA